VEKGGRGKMWCGGGGKELLMFIVFIVGIRRRKGKSEKGRELGMSEWKARISA
jgi:hypothetical protein